MKRLFLIATTVLLILVLAVGCGGKKEPSSPEPTPEATPSAELKDGIYNAIEDNFDDHGWKGMATVVVKGGKIVAAFFDEVNEEGQLKSFDAAYNPRMKDASGSFPMEAYIALQNDLLAKQNAEKVDAVSGATSSSNGFKELMAKALSGEPISASGNYADGLYKAVAKDFDERGWRSAAAVVIEDGKIVSAFYDEYNKDAMFKSADEDYAQRMEAQAGTTPAKASEAFTKSIVDKQDVAAVDSVSGATGSFNNFKALMEEALSHAK